MADIINVEQLGTWNAHVDTRYWSNLPIKRPYVINESYIEYIEGDWNPEKTQYGIRIGFASGTVRCFWGETARKVLESLAEYRVDSEELLKKYDERVKAGPPTM